MASESKPAYQPKDAISASVRSTMIVGGAGLFLSAVQNSLTRQNVTGWGVLTRTGGTIGIFGTLQFQRPLPGSHDLIGKQLQLAEAMNSLE